MPKNNINSRVDKSAGIEATNEYEKPNITFSHDLKKKVGPIRYKKNIRKKVIIGKKSKKKEKNRNSAIKKIEPGNPKNTRLFSKVIRKSFGHK